MNSFKIAVPTNDSVNIAERTGRAKGFMVFTIENKEIKTSTYRVNTHKHHEGNNHNDGKHNHNDVMAVLEDCRYIIVIRLGKHFKQDLDTAGIETIKTNKLEILEAVNDFIA